MSAIHPRGSTGKLLALFTLAASLAVVGGVRADDLLDRKAREQAVAAQKVIGEVKGLIADSRKAEAKDPAAARDLLTRARTILEDANGVADRDRADLLAQIRNRLRDVQASLRDQENAGKAAAAKADLKRREEERKRDLERQNRENSPVGKSNDFIKTGKGALGYGDKLRTQREQGTLAINRDILDSAGRMDEKRFGERWKWVTENRPIGPKLTKAEKELLKMLNSTLSVDFNKTALKDVIEFLHDKANLNIFVDENSLKEANVEYDDPVTFKVRKATVRTILRKVLADKGLTFVIKDAAIQVITPARMKDFMVTRAYPIADLLPVINPNMPAGLNAFQQGQHVQGLISLITQTVEPETWQVNGGLGTIVFNPGSRSLVIRQPAEFHYQMGGALGR